MNKHHIPLTDEEKALVEAIIFDWDRYNADVHEVYLNNEQPVLALVDSLARRQAVPEVRLKFWCDPKYQTDKRTKLSNKGIFERNGCTGQEIYTHLHFLPYLYYFLFGANLPDVVILKFEEKVGNPDWITSGDVLPICEHARMLTRQFKLKHYRVPEEFYKLCLDIGLDRYAARMVRREVKTAQRGIK